jgi:enhancer of mRNA-decapping protein 4
METQSRYIAELRNEIYSLKGQSSAEAMVTQKNMSLVQENCKKAIEQNSVNYENSLMIRDKQQRELFENLVQMFQQISRNQVNTIESSMKENLLKICSHKGFVESISQSMLSGIQKTIELSFRKSLEETMLPSYQKMTNQMFQEMGQAFTNGTKEYIRAFDTYMKQYGAVQFQMTEFSGAIHDIPQQIERAQQKTIVPIFNSRFIELHNKIDKVNAKFMHDLKEQVKAEIQSCFERQTVNLEESVLSVVQRSHAETPAPTIYDHQESIKQMLAHGETNKAFHQALISSDLSMLEFTIDKADFTKVFEPCPLDQSVLLSLIQQLTADMSKFSEIKMR